MSEKDKILGNNIQKLRKEKGWTQKQLAGKVDSAVITIQQYELGKREPRIDQLKKIAVALGVSVDDLTADNVASELAPEEWAKEAVAGKFDTDPLPDISYNDLLIEMEEIKEKIANDTASNDEIFKYGLLRSSINYKDYHLIKKHKGKDGFFIKKDK